VWFKITYGCCIYILILGLEVLNLGLVHGRDKSPALGLEYEVLGPVFPHHINLQLI